MLVVRDEQLLRFPSGIDPEFENMALEFIREQFPEIQEANDDAVRLFIRDGVSLAYDYDLQSPTNVLRFIGLMFLFGPNFHNDPNLPWSTKILNSGELEETEKIKALYEAGAIVEETLSEVN